MSQSRPLTRPLGAQISHMLKARGVDVIFGIPGVHNQEMYRGIEEAGITHVLARHEQGAGFMADGYARATGRPGVCYIITGPGLTNTLTPLGQAYSDSVPVLAISSCLDETAATRGQLHQMRDQAGAARTVCEWSETANDADAAYALIDRAIMEWHIARKRPKHITVPIARLEAPAEASWPNGASFYPRRVPADPDWVNYVADNLQNAKRPVCIFGGGAVQVGYPAPGESEPENLLRLLDKSGAASFTTYAGRGIVPASAPLHFGSTLARPSSKDVLAKADLVVAFGSELAEVDLWRRDLGHDCLLIRVDIDPEILSSKAHNEWAVLSDAEAMVDALAQALEPSQSDWSADEVAETRLRWRAEVEAERPGIIAVADALRECLPEGTMIYSDMTQFAYSSKEVWDMDRPGQWHHPTGFGTLGYALPAAIGGAVAREGKPTLAIAGDYGFQYTLQELGTAVELGLPLPIFLWDNGKLKEIEDSMVAAQIPPNAVVARNPDFVALAKAYGAYGAAPKTLAELQEVTRAAFEADAPTLIYVTPDVL
ncbi:MAG: thiamine pyrophosphate-binding protein [Pseudomonadota bacterium]